MASFSNKKYFDARAYLTTRPKYSPACLELIKAWHDRGAGSSGAASYDEAVDLGCGPGQMTYFLGTLFKHVDGVDPSEVMINAASTPNLVSETLNVHLPRGHAVNFKVAPAERNGLESGKYDLVSAATAAHWFPWKDDSEALWKEFSRLLKPNGSLVFTSYTTITIPECPTISQKFNTFIKDPEAGFATYFEFESDLSPTRIGCSYFKTLPPPTEESGFDTSQTFFLRQNAEVDIGTELEASDIAPLPDWVEAHTSIKTTSQPIVSKKETLSHLALFLRSASAWPKYVQDHPEEKALEAERKDLPFRLLDQWRKEEQTANPGSRLIDWDDEIQFTYPAVVLFARKRG